MRHPILAAGATTALLLALAVPALQMEMRNGALAQFPKGHETRVGAEVAARITGPGAATPLDVVTARAAAPRVHAALKADREIAGVDRAGRSRATARRR